jgi:hypothetical protein
MPALGAVDPADLRAQARAELGLSRELAQPRRVKPHPREGGSSGYPDRRTTTTPARRGRRSHRDEGDDASGIVGA